MQNSTAPRRGRGSDDRFHLRGRIWTGLQGAGALVDDGVVEIAAGTVRSVHEASSDDPPAPRDAEGRLLTVIPGMVDLHNHGGAGHSFPTSGPTGCRAAVAHHRSRGTTTMLASLVSASAEKLHAQAGVLAEVAESGEIAGIHLEGPFLSAARCGAQDPEALIPGDPGLLTRLIEAAGGHLRSVTLAPETARLEELLAVCAEHAVVVSFGHSDASAERTEQALGAADAAGVRATATHLFNGMPVMHHREPGVAGVLMTAAAEGSLTAELIADGVHLDDHMVNLMLATAPNSVAFVSDAMAAAGKDDGDYTLGGVSVTVRDGVARLEPKDGQETAGSIAGGTSAVCDQLLRHAGDALVAADAHSDPARLRAAQVVRACAVNPARAIGLDDRGTLEPGMRADLMRLDSRGRVVDVLSAGAFCIGGQQ